MCRYQSQGRSKNGYKLIDGSSIMPYITGEQKCSPVIILWFAICYLAADLLYLIIKIQ